MRAWRGDRVIAVAAAVVLPLVVCAAGAVPASAALGYTVTATIEVGNGPDGAAVDPGAHTLYVTNVDDDTVSVIDEATGTVTGTVTVGGGPLAVAADPTTHTAYVTNGGNGTVSVIDGPTGTVTAIITVGSGPDGVAVDPTSHTAYVANGGAGTVSVIDEASGTVTGTIAVGSDPDGVAVDPTTHTVYVANGGAGTVSVIDEASGTVTGTIAVGSDPDGVAVDPTTHTAYVANGGAGTVSVIDEASGTVTGTIKVGSDPDGVAVDPTTHAAYVANLAGNVSVIDEATETVTATVPVDAYPSGVAVDPTFHTAYVTNAGIGTVSVISVSRPTPVTAVTSSPNPSTFGQNVTFTATVGPADGGTITFSGGSQALCRAVSLTHVSGTTYHATCTTKALPAGRDTITAVYPGDAGYATSGGRLTQTVAQAPTTLTARIDPSPLLAFTLTATLTTSGRPLGGQPVSFSIGSTHLCTQHTTTTGVAICLFTGPGTRLAAQDNDIIRVSYPGSTSYRPSSAIAPLSWSPNSGHNAREKNSRLIGQKIGL